MTSQDLISYIELGRLPVIVYCEKKYEGICCMLKVSRNNTIFLDYDDTYIDAESKGTFRATFKYDSFDKMLQAIEKFTKNDLNELVINPYCYDKFSGEEPKWLEFQWDLYNGKIKLLDNYNEFFIGDFWWNGLFQKKIRPDSTKEELDSLIKQFL